MNCWIVPVQVSSRQISFALPRRMKRSKKDNVQGQDAASQTHFVVGDKVRRAIEDIGGTVPEQLLPERHIKEVKKSEAVDA